MMNRHTTPRAMLGFALLLATLPLAALPAAAECTTQALVTLGGPGYPSEGVYYENDCSPGPQGDPGAQAEVGSANGALVPAQSVPVEGIYVLGTKVPGTGRTYDTPAVGGPVTLRQGAPTPDTGVATCLNRLGFTCTYTSPAFADFLCGDIDTGVIALVGGYSVRASCTLA